MTRFAAGDRRLVARRIIIICFLSTHAYCRVARTGAQLPQLSCLLSRLKLRSHVRTRCHAAPCDVLRHFSPQYAATNRGISPIVHARRQICIWREKRLVIASLNQAWSERKHSLTFRVRHFVVSKETRAPTANPPNSAQLEGTPSPYHSPKLHPGPCSSVGMRRGTDTRTDTQTAVTTIHFASSTTHAKCNRSYVAVNIRPSLSYIVNKQQQRLSRACCCYRQPFSCIYLTHISIRSQHARAGVNAVSVCGVFVWFFSIRDD